MLLTPRCRTGKHLVALPLQFGHVAKRVLSLEGEEVRHEEEPKQQLRHSARSINSLSSYY